jgi:hypothetical protein
MSEHDPEYQCLEFKTLLFLNQDTHSLELLFCDTKVPTLQAGTLCLSNVPGILEPFPISIATVD